MLVNRRAKVKVAEAVPKNKKVATLKKDGTRLSDLDTEVVRW